MKKHTTEIEESTLQTIRDNAGKIKESYLAGTIDCFLFKEKSK